jgi:hypothetical protein
MHFTLERLHAMYISPYVGFDGIKRSGDIAPFVQKFGNK